MRVYSKLSVVLLAFIILPVAFVSYMVFYNSKTVIEKEIFSRLNSTIDHEVESIEIFSSERKSDLDVLGRLDIYRTILPSLDKFCEDRSNPSYIEAKKKIDRHLTVFQSAYQYVDIMLTNIDGKIIYVFTPQHGSELCTFVPGDILQKARIGSYIGDVHKTTDNEHPYTLYLVGPIYGEGDKVIGLVHLEVDMALVYKFIQRDSGLGKSEEAILVKKKPDNKIAFISPLKSEPVATLEKAIDIGGKEALPAQQAVSESGSGMTIDYRGKEVLAAWRSIPSMGWGIVTKIDKGEAFLSIERLKSLLLIVILLTILSIMFAAFAVVKSISDPIRELRKGIEIIGNGNLDYKVGIDTKDEVGELSLAFDRMTGDLSKTTTSIENLNKEIAERKKIEHELRRLTAIVEFSEDAIIGKNLDGTIFSWNKGAERIFGYKAQEMIGRNVSILATPELKNEITEILEKIKRKEVVEHFETVRVAKDARKIAVSLTVSAIVDNSGRVIGASSISRDVTRHKQAEEQIAQALKEWERTFNSISDLIFIQDNNFTITKVNNACCKALKLKPEEIIGRKCYEVFHKLGHPWPDCPGSKMQADHDSHEGEVDDPHIGVPLLVTVSPIFNAKGEFIGSVHIARDISERKRVEKALREIIDMKTDFTSTVSHELRTPLAAIKEGISIVLDGTSGAISKDQKEFLDIAKRNVDRLARIINDILDFQKLESGKMVFAMQPNDINEVAKEAGENMRGVIENKGLVLALELGQELPKIQFDRDKIIQVLTNLINNAVKFTETGSIKIQTIKADNFIKVLVNDTGIGIKESDIPLLFERFKQLDSGMTRKPGGTGLGLSICKDIVEKHNGKIWVESAVGKGSIFGFTLPVL